MTGSVTGTAAGRCASPGCSRPIQARGTGRPRRYCSPACRQAAHRDRARAAEAGRQLAARLADARATAARTWRTLEEAAHDAADAARAVFTCAADGTRADLVCALTELRHAVAGLERLALRYWDASDEAARISGPGILTARVSAGQAGVTCVQLCAVSEIYPMTRARAVLGSLVRRAASGRERITITDHGQPAAVLINAQELADLEDAAALAEYRLRQATGTAGSPVPHDEVRRRLGLPAR